VIATMAAPANKRTEDGGQRSVQEELPLSCLRSHKLFPGRTTLYIKEVADALRTSENQIISLIEEGKLHAVNIAGAGNKTDRKYWRIGVDDFDAYVQANSSVKEFGS
jgi:hypothetical protein